MAIITEKRSDGSVRVALRFGDADDELSRTKQSHKDECDLNLIMKRFRKTGVIPVNSQSPIYGDFSEGLSFDVLQEKLAKAQEVFDALPVDVRKQMGFDPAKMVEFVLDDKNYDRCVELGLRAKDPVKEDAKKKASDLAIAEKAKKDKADFIAAVREAMAGAPPAQAGQ